MKTPDIIINESWCRHNLHSDLENSVQRAVKCHPKRLASRPSRFQLHVLASAIAKVSTLARGVNHPVRETSLKLFTKASSGSGVN
jgi:hypothetical protein